MSSSMRAEEFLHVVEGEQSWTVRLRCPPGSTVDVCKNLLIYQPLQCGVSRYVSAKSPIASDTLCQPQTLHHLLLDLSSAALRGTSR